MANGYYVIRRDNIDPRWDYKLRSLYVELVRLASKPLRVVWSVNVGAGQYLTTSKAIAEVTGDSPRTILYRLHRLANDGVIDLKTVACRNSGRRGLLITLRCVPNEGGNSLKHNKLRSDYNSKLRTDCTPNCESDCAPISFQDNELQKDCVPLITHQIADTTYTLPTEDSSCVRARTCEAIEAELGGLISDEWTHYMIAQKSGGADEDALRTHLHEFAVEQTLKREEGGEVEHGMRLATHYGFWLSRKLRARRREEATPPAPTATLERAYELITNQKLR